MNKENVLVVEDEKDILELISYNLEKEGYKVHRALTGEEAVKIIRDRPPDLVILDLMLPGIDGIEICKQLRSGQKTKHIPIIMLTAKSEEVDIVLGLELGADDYVTKPFSPKVLVARVKAVLRRKSMESAKEDSPIRIHDLVMHPGRHEVLLGGSQVELTFTEFRILQLLITRPGWVYTRNQIVEAVRGRDYPVTDRAVDVMIVSLRKKLGSYGKHLETVRGVGYRFKE